MKVKNINGRRQNSCKCGTWLDHWANICGRPLPRHCAAKTCLAKPELGAHVQRDSSTDSNWYIIPLCVKHSIQAASLEIADTTTFVSAHVSETCARQMPIGNVWLRELVATIGTNAQERGAVFAALDFLDAGQPRAKPRIIRLGAQPPNAKV